MSYVKRAYPGIPGRGIMNEIGYQQRIDFLNQLPSNFSSIINSNLKQDQVKNNIESFIGTVEIPIGLVGPLLFKDKEEDEFVYSGITTTEGALVASMNRGAKAISECGGFTAHVIHQKMLRAPMFTFNSIHEALEFERWIHENFEAIKKVAQNYSNHANLLEIKSRVIGKITHLKFIFSTGDASGQNMTTTCTWHACLWIDKNFNKSHPFPILHFVIDGNGASDKKVTYQSLQSGRGVHVISECFLSNEIIEKTLRTNSEDMFRSFNHSMAISRMDGMIGYNINIANAIAGIFASTGQDMASIHESSVGILQMEKTDEGLYLSLSLPNLVIGTVGGGTNLPTQKSILELMKCEGAGKVKRFAQLIAGFALSLEISTLAAIVSGQFARAHQKLGRNKPVNWLLMSEITPGYILNYSKETFAIRSTTIKINDPATFENGIITDLTNRISKKLIGFIPFTQYKEDGTAYEAVIKSKPLDKEVIKGLHFLASNLNVELADLIEKHQNQLEYINNHLKEIDLYRYFDANAFNITPHFIGEHIDPSREVYLFMMECLQKEKLAVFNSENEPSLWTNERIRKAIEQITKVHCHFLTEEVPKSVQEFDSSQAIPLYVFMNEMNQKEYVTWNQGCSFEDIQKNILPTETTTPKTLIHNDFNPRNIAIRNDESLVFYDWELAVIDLPQRDIVELLSFTLGADFEESLFVEYIRYHHQLFETSSHSSIELKAWIDDTITAAYQYQYTRVAFYLTGKVLMDYSFVERVFKTTNRMIQILKSYQFD